uniref:Symplekin n=1 Tax=Meloidogyne javanica TaxID=6303 RepID=A0A915LHB7_MELJA
MAEGNSLYDEIGSEINEALQMSGKSLEERYMHLARAEEMILKQDNSSVLDNFLDEMVQFIHEKEQKIRCFAINFIEKACKKDPEVFKRAIATLSWALTDQSGGVIIQKKAINTCTQLYPVLLRWASQKRSTDDEAKNCWETFSMLKNKIMQTVDSENEGIKTMAFKFLEMLIICQLPKTEFSETPRTSNQQISLDEIGRDSFISWRQLQSEAIKSFNSLIEHMASTHITSLNLVTAISSTCNIARQRPEKMADVVSALEQLHLNLPPTLGTSQVKSVRKELKMHLLRMMKHPGSFTLHNLHARMKQLLIELGATPSEIQKAMPGPNEIDAALKRRLAAATAARKLQQTESGTDEKPSRKKPHSGEKLSDSLQDEDLDLRDTKRLKLGEDEDYDDGTIDLYRQLDDPDSASAATQKAIDITTEFVLERLSISVLVIISLYTLPDEMPPAFASSYTPIDEVGSEAQKRHLARMMAIQMTREGEGPGVEYIKAEKQKQFVEKQSAARSSEVIDKEKSNDETKKVIDEGTTSSLVQTAQPPTTQKTRIQNWTLFNATRELFHKESEQLQLDIFQRILGNEKRAVQGGAGLAQQKLLIRLCTRFRSALTSELEATLLNYVIEEQKTRVDLALLHLAELYAQLMGYSTLVSPKAFNQLTNEEKKQRYDTYLCTLLSTLHERGEHKETLFHRIFLEAPFLTSGSLKILRKACLDKVYGAFAITTLRELILTRARQRQELLRLLIEFSYFERVDIREHCVKTIKELYQLDFLRSDVRGFLVEMSELLVAPTAPRVIWHANGRLARELEEIIDEMPWDESLIRAGLFLFLSLLPQEPSLLKQLASVYARAGTEIKRVTFRSIEQAIKAIGMHSEDLLDMIENCQPDAETLVARIVHLLTERNAPTPALVDRVRKLHQARNTDVRSLIPILNSLKKEELIELIPSFVLSAKNSNSVPIFFKKLLFGRHTDTNQAVLSPFELLLELHRLKANRKEQGFLMQNLDILLVDTAREFSFGKDVLAIAIETLINDKVFPVILFYTIQKVNEAQPTLNGFLTGLLEKIAQRKPWTEIEGDDTARETIWHKFEICSKALGSNVHTRFPHLTLQPEANVDISTAVLEKLESTEEKEKPMEEDKPLLNEQITMEK